MGFPVGVCKTGYQLKPLLCSYQPKQEPLSHYSSYGSCLLSSIMRIAWYVLFHCRFLEIRDSLVLFKSKNCPLSCLYLLVTSTLLTHMSYLTCQRSLMFFLACALTVPSYFTCLSKAIRSIGGFSAIIPAVATAIVQ